MTRKEEPMRRSITCLLGLVLVAAVAATAASADSGSPNYRSKLVVVTPKTKGLLVRIVDGDDALELENATGGNVMVPGYEGEPYLRFLKSGRVEVNVNSPAKYLNEERYGGVAVPEGVGAKAKPRWQPIAQEGVYTWHEHRIHWMSTLEPPRVKESGGKTLMKIFDWNVPVKVGGEHVKVSGKLWWVPTGQLERADALIAAAVAKEAREKKAASQVTEEPQVTVPIDEQVEQALPAVVPEADSSSPLLWVVIAVLAAGLVGLGAYVFRLRRRDPTAPAPEGEVW